MASNGLQVGHFGFFKDPELTLRISDENLYDQIDANGWINVWFGGRNIFLPEYGEFNVYLTCDETFFWDIVDEDGKRTKTGFSEIYIPYNPNMEPYTGDIIPLNSEELFHDSIDNKLICSNLWFYSNLFLDEYYRYNLILLPLDQPWPNEHDAIILPMNDKLLVPTGYKIAGYRPKPEYMNQLAVMKNVSSGVENSIMFKMRLDLDYMSDHPDAKRKIRIFSQTKDKSEYLVYPEKVTDIVWHGRSDMFINEYHRYLLENGVQQYLPSKTEVLSAIRIYDRAMKASNYVLRMDASNTSWVISDIDRLLGGETGVYLVGYSKVIIPEFLKWFSENVKDNVVRSVEEILLRVLLTKKKFTGFEILDDWLGGIIGSFAEGSSLPNTWDGNMEVANGNDMIANGGYLYPEFQPIEVVNIKVIDGVRQYEDGYVPYTAIEYLNPKNGYAYAGDIGNGVYKIKIAEQDVDIFCNMTDDGGGWMYVIAGYNTEINYMNSLGDASQVSDTIYRDENYGLGWGTNNGTDETFRTYNIPFNQVKCQLSGTYDEPEGATGYLNMVTSTSGTIVSFVDNHEYGYEGQSLIVDGEEKMADPETDLIIENILSIAGEAGSVNTLSIKMRADSNTPYSRRFIQMLAIR